jgi:hypothetical protein
MKLTDDYTEIVGVTHKHGEEECHNLLPQVTKLEAANARLERENRALRANASKSVLRRLEVQLEDDEGSDWEDDFGPMWDSPQRGNDDPV